MRIYIGHRLYFFDKKRGYIYNKYPHVSKTVIEDWKDSDDILIPSGVLIGTFLKAFHGAPLYTQEELEIWNECFAEIGMIKKGKRKISNKKLNESFCIGFKEISD